MEEDTQNPITPQEFAQKVKAKYPQYANVDDLTLAKKMVEKYPQYSNQVNFDTDVKKKGIGESNTQIPQQNTTESPSAVGSLATQSQNEDGVFKKTANYLGALESEGAKTALTWADNIINSSKNMLKETGFFDDKVPDTATPITDAVKQNMASKGATETYKPAEQQGLISKIINSALPQDQKNLLTAGLGLGSAHIQNAIKRIDKYQKESLPEGNLPTEVAKGVVGFVPEILGAALLENPEPAIGKATLWTEKAVTEAKPLIKKYAPKAVKFLEEGAKSAMTKIMAAKGATEAMANAKENDNTFIQGLKGGIEGFAEGLYLHGLGEITGKVTPVIAKQVAKAGVNSAVATAIVNPLATAGVFTTARALRTGITEQRLLSKGEVTQEAAMGIGFSLLHAGSLYKNHNELNHYYDNVLKTDPLGSYVRVLNETKDNLEIAHNENLTETDVKDLTESRNQLRDAILKEPDLELKKKLGDQALKIQNQLDAHTTINNIVENKDAVIEDINNNEDLNDDQKSFYTKKAAAIADYFDNSELGLKKKELNTKISEAQASLDEASLGFTDLESQADRDTAKTNIDEKRQILEGLNTELTDLTNNAVIETPEVKIAKLESELETIKDDNNPRIAEIDTEINNLETLKKEQDAIQKQRTNESVLRTEQPELGLQKVGEGNAKPEIPTEQTITNAQPQEVKDYKTYFDQDVPNMTVQENNGEFLIGNYTPASEGNNPSMKTITDLDGNPLTFKTKEEAQAKLDEVKRIESQPQEVVTEEVKPTEVTPEGPKTAEEFITAIDEKAKSDLSGVGAPIEIAEKTYISKVGDTYNISFPDKRANDGIARKNNLTKEQAIDILNKKITNENKPTKINPRDYKTKEINANELKVGDIYIRDENGQRYVYKLLENPRVDPSKRNFFNAEVELMHIGTYDNESAKKYGSIEKNVGDKSLDRFKSRKALVRDFGKVKVIENWNETKPTEVATVEEPTEVATVESKELYKLNKEISQLEDDVNYYESKIEDIQDEIKTEQSNTKEGIVELKEKIKKELEEVKKDKSLSRDEKLDKIEEIKYQIENFKEDQQDIIDSYKDDLSEAKIDLKKTSNKLKKLYDKKNAIPTAEPAKVLEVKTPDITTIEEPKPVEKPTEEPESLRVGIRNESMKRVANELGLEAPVPGEGWNSEDAVQVGRELLKAGADIDAIVEKVKSGEVLTAEELAVARAHFEDTLIKDVNEAYKKGIDSPEYIEAKAKADKFNKDVIAPTKLAWSKTGAAFRGETDIYDGSFYKLENEFKKELNVDELTKEQSDLVQKLADDIAKAKTELQDTYDKISKAKDELAEQYEKKNGKKEKEIDLSTKETDDIDKKIKQRIKQLQKQIDDVQSGKVKPTKESSVWAKEISDLTATLKDVKYQDRLIKLRENLKGKTDNKFNPSQAKAIWDYAKETYLDKGVEFADMVRMVTEDLGLNNVRQTMEAIVLPKSSRVTTVDMYEKRNKINQAQNLAREFIKEANTPKFVLALKSIPDMFRKIKVYGHGGVGFMTHLIGGLKRPSEYSHSMKMFTNQYKYMFSKKYYEQAKIVHLADPNYYLFLKEGADINPEVHNTGYEVGKSNSAGERAFFALKAIRLSQMSEQYNKAPEIIKSDPNFLKNLVAEYNYSSGSSKYKTEAGRVTTRGHLGGLEEVANTVLFAKNLTVAKYQSTILNPTRALGTLLNSKSSVGEKYVAKITLRRQMEGLAVHAAALALNQFVLATLGSKEKVNVTDPTKPDFLCTKLEDGSYIPLTKSNDQSYKLLASLGEISYKQVIGEKHKSSVLNSLSTQGRYMLSPIAGTVTDIALKKDVMNNPLAFIGGKDKKKRGIGFMEYILRNQTPIPVGEAITHYFKEKYDKNKNNETAKIFLESLGHAILAGGLGTDKKEPIKEKGKISKEELKKTNPKMYKIMFGGS